MQWKKILKPALKIAITAAAIWFVFRKIDVHQLTVHLQKVNPLWFLCAIVAFLISKLVSAYRQNEFYAAAGIRLEEGYNLKLYAVGMFYNLFLPGSIGGDAYKVYLIKQEHKKLSTRKLISATLLDRLSGVVILFMMFLGFLWFSHFTLLEQNWVKGLLVFGLIASLPALYLIIHFFFSGFTERFAKTTWHSVLVQSGQVIAAIFLFMAVGIHQNWMDYLSLFMASSVVAVLPITIGGIGARELVFILGHQWLPVDQEKAVAFSFLFFLVTAFSSLTGLIFIPTIDRKKKNDEITVA